VPVPVAEREREAEPRAGELEVGPLEVEQPVAPRAVGPVLFPFRLESRREIRVGPQERVLELGRDQWVLFRGKQANFQELRWDQSVRAPSARGGQKARWPGGSSAVAPAPGVARGIQRDEGGPAAAEPASAVETREAPGAAGVAVGP